MKEDHEPGKCHCCHEDTSVRWKNIYHMGSEGLWICMPCEMKLVHLVRRLSMEAIRKKMALILSEKNIINNYEQLINNSNKTGGEQNGK